MPSRTQHQAYGTVTSRAAHIGQAIADRRLTTNRGRTTETLQQLNNTRVNCLLRRDKNSKKRRLITKRTNVHYYICINQSMPVILGNHNSIKGSIMLKATTLIPEHQYRFAFATKYFKPNGSPSKRLMDRHTIQRPCKQIP